MKFDIGHINKIAVVNIVLNGDEQRFHYLILKKVKNEINFVKKAERILDFEVLVKAVANLPVLVHFTGKGILNRKAVRQENYRHSILLNANMDAFYFSDYLEDKTVFSSVIRKDTVDGFVASFAAQKVQVISISSGPFHAAMLHELIQSKPGMPLDKVSVEDISLVFSNGILTDFGRVSDETEVGFQSVMLGDERISHHLLPCAAAGAAFFNPPLANKVVFPENEPVFAVNLEEARQRNVFLRFGMGMMFFFLLILSANYFYLGHLNQVVADNAVFLMEYDEQLNQIADLEEEKDRKEKLLQSSGLLNKNFLSFYLMEIANSVPKDISFDEIIVRPLQEEIKDRKKIAFEEHLVLINGRARSSHVLSLWIEELEQADWLAKVDILRYDFVKNEGVFELEMMVY